jgi:hypothetical protein
VCPECGQSLAGKRSLRIGNRRRRAGLGLSGLALVVLGAGSIAGGAIAETQRVDWIAAKPAWMLQRQALSGEAAIAAVTELTKRIERGRVGKERCNALVAYALGVQGNLDCIWDLEWGGLIEAGRRKGLVSDEQWSTYLRQGLPLRMGVVSPALRVAPVEAQRHPMDEYRRYFQVILGPARLGPKVLPGLTVRGDMTGAEVGGAPRVLGPDINRDQPLSWTGQRLYFHGCLDDLSEQEALEVRTRWVFSVVHESFEAASWEHEGQATGLWKPQPWQ